MPPLSYGRYRAELPAETTRFAAAVRGANRSQRVPTCPEWTVAELAAHVGFGHRWAALVVERRATEPVPHDEVDDLQVPLETEDLSRWLMAGAKRLVDAIREAGPHTAVWSWSEDQTAGFWLRRITHDTLVHRFDAELAVGRVVAVTPELAADSVSDLLDLFRILPRVDDFPALAGFRGVGQTLHFHANDSNLGAAGEWLARRTPSGVEWEHRHGQGNVVVRGPAMDLLLVLSRRAALDDSRLEVSGDHALLDHWLDHSQLEPA